MEYSSNPRRVHGKVVIVYADSEISMDLSVQTSGNGEISYPEQVFKSYLTPTIKACTMDGNSTMGGGYQMNGLGLVTGWWSDVHCDDQGVFETPPWIKVSFIPRPMIRWTLLGDNKLNQYPVDFNLVSYSGDRIVNTLPIRNNDRVGMQIYYQVPLVDITALKLEILKWSHPNAKAKMLQSFDIVEEEYNGDDIKEFEVLEEVAKDSDIGYGINSDTASFTLYNRDRKFDRGYLRSLLLLGRKVVPYIGIEKEDGTVDYTRFGTFYSDEWQVPQSDVWVKLKCVDRMSSLQNQTYVGHPLTMNATLYDIAKDILEKTGFKEEEYSIDERLREDVVYNAFMRKGSVWDSIQALCYAALANCYFNRNDKLIITKENINPVNMQVLADRITAYEKATRRTDFCNYVEVNYTDVFEETTEVTAYENTITLDPGTTRTLVVDYSSEVSSAYITYLPSVGIDLVEFESGVNAAKITLRNRNVSLVSTTITIKGFQMTTSTQTVSVEDSKSIEAWGRQEFVYDSNDLIQSYERATEIGQKVLGMLSEVNGFIKITWRGDPALQINDSFVAVDRFGSADKCVNEYNRYKFDGGLKQDSRGRLINGDLE